MTRAIGYVAVASAVIAMSVNHIHPLAIFFVGTVGFVMVACSGEDIR